MNFYKSAAFALDHLDKHQGSVKGSLVAAGVTTASSGGESKRILALVIETLKYRSVIQQILTVVPLLSLEKLTFPKKTPPKTPTSHNLLQVLVHDLLFSSKLRIEASDKWPPKEAVMRHQARLRAEVVRIQIREGKARKEELGKQPIGGEGARYVRFNPNIDDSREGDWSLSALFEHLSQLGFTKLDQAIYPVPHKSYFVDPHLEPVLVFSPNTNWWVGDKWYDGGAIILQDKASCFPAKVLMEDWKDGEGECLDATAAPGNKTSYISALMGNKGKLHAFERSSHRFKTLETMLARAKCDNVVPQRADFTETKPKDYPNVTRILLDPSCSGSGIVNRLDYLVEDDADEPDARSERLDKLSTFQLQMVLHAFEFPNAKRIVYSTCSIHPEEDEQVVMRALGSSVARQRGWSLAPRGSVLPTWERRGRVEEMKDDANLADSVIRCLPGVDKTNGFFVACFVRGSSPDAAHSTKRERFDEDEYDKSDDESKMVQDDRTIADDVAEEVSEVDTMHTVKVKSQAQLERARRKKQQQRKRRKMAE